MGGERVVQGYSLEEHDWNFDSVYVVMNKRIRGISWMLLFPDSRAPLRIVARCAVCGVLGKKQGKWEPQTSIFGRVSTLTEIGKRIMKIYHTNDKEQLQQSTGNMPSNALPFLKLHA